MVGVEDSHVNCSASPDLELLKLWEGVLQVGWVAISPPHHTPRPRPQAWGLPRLGTCSSQAQSSWPGSGSSLASGSLHTQDEVGGWRSSQTRVLSLPRLWWLGGSPFLLTAREGPAHPQGLTLHPSSHSKVSFLFSLHWKSYPEVQNTYLCVLPQLLEYSYKYHLLTKVQKLSFLTWIFIFEKNVDPLPNILSNWHSMPRALSFWITSYLAIFVWLSSPMWVSAPSGLQLPAPTRSGQSHPWVELTRRTLTQDFSPWKTAPRKQEK